MATDTSEKELEATIEAYLIDEKGERAESSRWLKSGCVCMLYPESPKHPRQKYKLTVKGLAVWNEQNLK